MVDICANGFMNCSEVIGELIVNTTENTTGSLFLTFLFVVLMIIGIAMIFRIKIEYTALLVMPLMLALMSYYRDFIAIGGVILIYFSILVTKHFILK